MNIQRIQIQTEGKPRKSPVEIKFGPGVATRSQIIEAELAVERWLNDAREIRAMLTKLNGASPIPIPHDSYLDDTLAGGEDLLSELKGLPDAIWERYEGDR
jgi:hypothetical protein